MRPQAISFLHIPDDCSSLCGNQGEVRVTDHPPLAIYPQSMILTATAQEIEEECKKEIDTLKKDGGFILATGCEYPANASVRLCQAYGKNSSNLRKVLKS